MKQLVLILAMACPWGVHAEPMKLEFVKKPLAVYPSNLSTSGISGVVRLAFTAHSDGSVSDIELLQSSYGSLHSRHIAPSLNGA